MTRAMLKNTLREVRHTFSRFLSIFAIVALGVGFFAGVRATGPDMRLSADGYYRAYHLADMQLLSTLGFSDADVAAVRAVDGVAGVMPSWYVDVIAQMGDNFVTRVEPIFDLPADDPGHLNQLRLAEGRMPQAPDECVIDYKVLKSGAVGLGDTVTFQEGKPDDDLDDLLARRSYRIVGAAESPVHVDQTKRGNTTIGGGSIDICVYVPAENFIADYYTQLYIAYDKALDAPAYTDAYDRAAEELEARLEDLETTRAPARLEEVRAEGREKIDDAQAELDDGIREMDEKLADAARTIADAEQKLLDGQKKLEDGQRDYDDGLREFNEEIEKAQEEMDAAKRELRDGWDQYRDGRIQLMEGRKALDKAKEQLDAAQAEYNAKKQGFTQLLGALAALPFSDEVPFLPASEPGVAQLADSLNAGFVDDQGQSLGFGDLLLTEVNVGTDEDPVLIRAATPGTRDAAAGAVTAYQQGIEAQLAQGRMGYESGLVELEDGHRALSEARRELERGDRKYQEGLEEFEEEKAKGLAELEDGRKKIDDARRQLADGQAELADGKREYEEKKAEAEAEVADAQQKLDDARQDLSDLELPEWYIRDRGDYATAYQNYKDESERIDRIAAIFPVFFLAVAALVCLTTMTRMVEEQRTQIGTLKALGYTSGAIAAKYMVYALSACFLGAVFGLTVGFKLFPAVIYNAYNILYAMPGSALLCPFHWDVGLVSILAACLCAGGVTYAAVYGELRNMPAQSMRPKAPKAGKRVLLEAIPFLWRRLSFTTKVTMRNLFRYKKRVIMTVVGIAGCTALTLAGFGIQDAVDDIILNQYNDIVLYDIMVVYDEDSTPQEAADIRGAMDGQDGVEAWLDCYFQSLTAVSEKTGRKLDVNLSVPDRPQELPRFINLRTRIGHDPVPLGDDGAVITEKMSTLLELDVGDTFLLRDGDNREHRLRVSGITENYAAHFVYLTPAYYRQVFGEEAPRNTLLADLADRGLEDPVARRLLEEDGVIAVSQSSTIRGEFDNMSSSMGYVIMVLIISAGLLAFVVLYNLTNINITERIREIATLKVLGFYNREVSAYIYRENIILTVLGNLAGLLLGTVLTRFIVLNAELDSIMFGRNIYWESYLMAFALTLLFSLIVNVVMYFKLRRISMVESMKSID